MTDTIKVRPGQVWADNDARCIGRTLRVEEIKHSHRLNCEVAVCTILTNSDHVQRELEKPRDWYRPQDRRGAQVEIAIRRMRPTSTGYRLIEETR